MVPRRREVGTLWIGGRLSWMERLCLQSFVDRGQQITLFSYDDVPDVPAGVIRRDGREILDTADFLKYARKDSYALFADLFRLHMIHRCPGMIWVDSDVYCHRPMTYDSDVVLGFELPGRRRVNNAVLGLPADSAMLQAMLAFTADLHPVPDFLPPEEQTQLRAARDAGRPVHVSQQPWGVWGPMMLTHYIQRFAMQDQVQPLQAFYPVPYPDRQQFLRRAGVVDLAVTGQTTALHLWASNKREIGLRHDGLPPPGSWYDRACRDHGIRAAASPIAGRAGRAFDAALIDRIGPGPVRRLADIGGNARSIALAAHGRWDCAVDLIDLDPRGRWPAQPSDWVEPYRAALIAHGVPATRIRHIARPEDLAPCDLIANLAGFGDTAKVQHLAPVMAACLTGGTRMLTDIRKGSGAYPFLNAFGSCTTLTTREAEGKTVTRALFLANAAAAEPAPDSWAAIATGLMGPDGFLRDNGQHSFLHVPRASDTLVVTFDNLDIALGKREDRRPWGYAFIEKQGWSMLGVMAAGWTWYRDPWVADQFDDLAQSGFFAGYRRVIFYGASMGGYAACAFAPACPGAEVVAISPQSTLDKAVVPWETRYKVAWNKDFSGRYGDAAQAVQSAGRVTLLFDPHEPLDAAHAARFTGDNLLKLRAPLLGHRLGSSLQQMGILSPIALGALNGTLTRAEFYRLLRARRDFPRYQKELFRKAVERGHPELARRMARHLLTRGDSRFLRRQLEALG